MAVSQSRGWGFRISQVVLTFGLLSLPVAKGQTHVSRPGNTPNDATISVARLKIPRKAQEKLAKARQAFERNALDEALKQTGEALAIAPDFPDALTLRAYLELETDEYDRAVKDATRALEIDPGFDTAHLVLGSALNHVGRYDEAVVNLERAEIRDPQSWHCEIELAKAWLGKREYLRALTAVNRAEQRGADAKMKGSIHFLRGHALLGLKRYQEATIELRTYVALEPDGSMAATARQLLNVLDASGS